MQQLTRKDIASALITGLVTGFSGWRIGVFFEKPDFFGISLVWALLVIPLCWVAGVWLGYFLGQWLKFFNQFGKFAAIGFTNGAVDFGILYILIGLSGIAAGAMYVVFKSISFLIAMLHSYFWNKIWAFESVASGGGAGEFAKFFTVTVITFLINVGTATTVVNIIGLQFGISPEGWAGVGALVGSAIGLVFSFVGFRLIVFKK